MKSFAKDTLPSGGNLSQAVIDHSRSQVAKPNVFDGSAAVMESYGMLRRVIGENIELVLLPAEELPSVFIGPTQLDQIIMNLAVNAQDAMPKDGTLTVSTGLATVDSQEVSTPARMFTTAPTSPALLEPPVFGLLCFASHSL